jgi:serine/threonine protein kinase
MMDVLQDGAAKIGDVGMAQIMTEGYLTKDNALGTLAWAAPELLLGEKCATCLSPGRLLFSNCLPPDLRVQLPC